MQDYRKVAYLIKEASKKQHNDIKSKEIVDLLSKVEFIISDLAERGELNIKNVYRDLNFWPSGVKKRYPTLYKQISDRVREYKKDIKNKREELFINEVKKLFKEYERREVVY